MIMNTTDLAAEELSTIQEYGIGTNVTGNEILPHQIIVPVFFSCCVIVGVIGNTLVIVVMNKTRTSSAKGLSNTNIFILNLAVADLIFLVLCVPFHTTVYTLLEWPFGRFLCYFAKYCEEVSKIASVFSLTALSFDRFIAVGLAPALKAKIRTRKNAVRGLIFIWISAIGIAIPVLYTRQYALALGVWVCAVSNIQLRRPYEIVLTLFGYLLPLVIIIGCYIGVVWCIRKSSKSSLVVSKSTEDTKKKVTVIVILVIVVFMICWLPHYISILWITFDADGFMDRSWTFGFRITAHCLAYANSCMNPFIYAFVSRQFRQDFAKVLTCRQIKGFETTVRRASERVTRKLSTKPLAARDADETENSGNNFAASTVKPIGVDRTDYPGAVAETETELLSEDVTFAASRHDASTL